MFLLPLSELSGRPDPIRGGGRMKVTRDRFVHRRGWRWRRPPAGEPVREASIGPDESRPPAALRAAARRGRGRGRRARWLGRRSSGSRSGWGPGSFTGPADRDRDRPSARAGSRRCRSPGVGSLDALAAGIAATPGGSGAPRSSRCSTPVGARRSRRSAGPDGDEALARRSSRDPRSSRSGVAGPGRDRLLAAGDGSLRFRDQLEAAGADVAAPDDPVHRVSARWHLRAG